MSMAPPAGDPTKSRMEVCACAQVAASARVKARAARGQAGAMRVKRFMASSLRLCVPRGAPPSGPSFEAGNLDMDTKQLRNCCRRASPKPALGGNREVRHVLPRCRHSRLGAFDTISEVHQPERQFGLGG